MKTFLFFLFVFIGCGSGKRILAVFPFSGKSHFFTFEPVLTELVKRGHDLTVISYFPRTHKIENYTDIELKGESVHGMYEVTLSFWANMDQRVSLIMDGITKITSSYEDIYKDIRVQNLLSSSSQFDLIISELFISDMFIGLAEKYKAPLVMMSSSEIVAWAADRIAVPDNPSYIQHFFNTRGAGRMSFYERLANTIETVYFKFYYDYEITSKDELLSQKYLSVSPVRELMKKTDLVLVNSHFSVNKVRPLPPSVVEIGGIHIKPAKPLPQDIETFIEESQHGVVYFSLGSLANSSTMDVEMRRAFCNVFSKLPQRVLWKWELDEMPNKPKNVMIVKWMPQRDVLAHPNVRLFIGHGGLLGTMEAVHSAVPMVGIPLFGDQYQNIAHLVQLGYALSLDLKSITEESLSYAVNTVLNDQRTDGLFNFVLQDVLLKPISMHNNIYKERAKILSQVFRDRSMSPLDTAIYWIEYVLRHGGSHLRSNAVNLPWYQYLLLDVIGTLVLVVVVTIFVISYTIKSVIKKIFIKRKLKLS